MSRNGASDADCPPTMPVAAVAVKRPGVGRRRRGGGGWRGSVRSGELVAAGADTAAGRAWGPADRAIWRSVSVDIIIPYKWLAVGRGRADWHENCSSSLAEEEEQPMSDVDASKWRMRVLVAMLGVSLALVVGCSCPTRFGAAPELGRVAVASPAAPAPPAAKARPSLLPAHGDLPSCPIGAPVRRDRRPPGAARGPTV